MSVKLSSLIFLSACIAFAGARAQDMKQFPPPSPPLVAPVPENADWTITVQYPHEPAISPTVPPHHDWRIAEVRSTKTGKLKRDLITSQEGIKSERWFVESMLLWTTPQGDVAACNAGNASLSDPDNDSPTVASGFPGVGWLRLDRFDRVVLYENRPCYHYVIGESEAWIDAVTRLPAAYKRGGNFYRFKFYSPPEGSLTMPPAFQKAWETLCNMRKRRK